MALTQISTAGVKDDAVTSGKIPANAVGSSEIADQAVTLDKLPHGTSSNNGKFLRANNGADPTFETVNTDLSADTSPQLGGQLQSNGQHINLEDNDKVKLGTNGDTELYHNNTDAYIQNHTGDLYIENVGTNSDDITIKAKDNVSIRVQSNESAIECFGDGSVDLYHDGNKKLETTSTGVTVTGTVAATSYTGDGSNLTNLPASGKVTNLVMNGNFKLAQRGTSNTSSGYKTVDRWKMTAGGANATLTQSQYSAISGTSPYAEGHHQAFRIENAGQNANTQGYVYMEHHIEAQDIVSSGWNYKSSSSYITLSFWVRGSVTQSYLITLNTNDGTVREWNHLVSLTGDQWTKVTMTIPGDSNITMNNDNGIGLALYFTPYLGSHYTSGSTVDQWVNHAGYTSRPDMGSTWWTTSNSTFMLTGVQLEAGNSASPYAHESYIETLNKCKRYCHVLADGEYTLLGIGMQYYSGYIFVDSGPIDMRTTPTMVAKSGASGAYVYETYFGNSPAYTHQISLDSKTKKDRAVINVLGNSTRHSEAVRVSAHAVTLNNSEPFVYLDAEL